MDTRISFPKREHERREAANSGTVIFVADLSGLGPSEPPAFEKLLVEHYTKIRQARLGFAATGVVVCAVHHETGEEQILCLAGKESYNSAIVGRHGRCDLYLDRDPSLSLRHLAILVGGDTGDASGQIRVLDLHTPRGFRDESGRKLSALRAHGPVFLRLGSYSILILPTGDLEDWPESGKKAWRALPEREYVDAREHEPMQARRLRPVDGPDVTHSEIVAVDGPLEIADVVAGMGENCLGTLLLTSEHGEEAIEIDPQAASRGILLGRYRRCASDHLIALANRRLSRVHLLIVDTGEGLYAVDTASTNQTRRGKDRIRSTPLEAGIRLTLPGDVQIEWQPAA